jgi:hypothetical protein
MSSVHHVFQPIGGREATPLSYASAQTSSAKAAKRANAFMLQFVFVSFPRSATFSNRGRERKHADSRASMLINMNQKPVEKM